MSELILFIIIVAITYYIFIRRGKSMAGMMGELALHGKEIDAKVVKKYQINSNKFSTRRNYIVYSFALANQQSFSKKISPSSEQWETLEEGDMLPVVYLADNPQASTTKELVDQIRAAMQDSNISKD